MELKQTTDKIQTLYKAFEVAICMVEEIRDHGSKVRSVDEGERALGLRTNSLAKNAADVEFKALSRRKRQRAYSLARDIADRLLQET